jgi:ribosomal protein L37AE/L43A
MLSSACPCCSNNLLRHIRSGEIYWFCSRCHQEMPDYTTLLSTLNPRTKFPYKSQLTKSGTPTRKALN